MAAQRYGLDRPICWVYLRRTEETESWTLHLLVLSFPGCLKFLAVVSASGRGLMIGRRGLEGGFVQLLEV